MGSGLGVTVYHLRIVSEAIRSCAIRNATLDQTANVVFVRWISVEQGLFRSGDDTGCITWASSALLGQH